MLVIAGCSGSDLSDETEDDEGALAAATTPSLPITTGNGYGFAVYAPKDKAIRKLYAHPYRFMRPNPSNARADGVPTPNLIERLAWRAGSASARATRVGYLAESNVIAVADETIEQTFVMPFTLERNVFVTTARGVAGDTRPCLAVEWARGGHVRETRAIADRRVGIVKFSGISDTIAIVPLEANARPNYASCATGSAGFAFAVLESESDLDAAVSDVVRWQTNATAEQLGPREVQAFDAWRVAPPASVRAPEARTLFRQSEAILRMAQIREANRDDRHGHGLILASLPDGEWFIPWVRDMTYATIALLRMGHLDEARAAVEGLLNAQPVGRMASLVRDVPYQISAVRYFGDGSEEADYSGEGAPNLELDSWGLALWAIGEFAARSSDATWLQASTYRGTIYENVRDYVVKPLLANLDAEDDGLIVAADTSPWEQNAQPRMHYAFSTIAAINGLQHFAPMADAMGDETTAADARAKIAALQTGLAKAFIRDGRLHGVLERSPKNDMDGSLLEAINFGVVTDPAIVTGTLNAMRTLSVASGGFRRVTGDTSYEKHEFLFIDFALARAKRKLGDAAGADAIVGNIVKKSVSAYGYIPEMYISERDDEFPGRIGDGTGANPMVGYGAGVFTLFMLER
jgi:hypothetical protein